MANRLKYVLTIALVALALAACAPDTPQAISNRGNQAFAAGDFAVALESYAAAQAALPDLAEPYYNMANVHYRQESYEDAATRLGETLARADGDGLAQSAHYNLGNVFFKTENLPAAIEAYKEALRLNPDDLDAKHNLELALQQQQQEQEEQEQQQEQQQQQQDQQNQEQQSEEQQEPQDGQATPTPQPPQEQQQDAQATPTPQEPEEQPGEEQEQEGEQNDQSEQDAQPTEQPPTATPEPQDQGDQQQDAGTPTPDPAGQQGGAQPTPTTAPQELQPPDSGGEEAQEEPPTDLGSGQPGSVGRGRLTEEQARQLLAVLGQQTETLQERLQQIYVAPEPPSAEDW